MCNPLNFCAKSLSLLKHKINNGGANCKNICWGQRISRGVQFLNKFWRMGIKFFTDFWGRSHFVVEFFPDFLKKMLRGVNIFMVWNNGPHPKSRGKRYTPINHSKKRSTPLTRTITDTHFNGKIMPMKWTTSVYITVPVINYLITACYDIIITYL